MRARHVWFVFAFMVGVGAFAETIYSNGIMWGFMSIMNGLREGAFATAIVLMLLAFVLSFDND